jgi:hypothetical protein
MSTEICFNKEELAAFSAKLPYFDPSLSENERNVLQLILAKAGAGTNNVLEGHAQPFSYPGQDKATLVKLAKAIDGKEAIASENDMDWLYNIWTYHF